MECIEARALKSSVLSQMAAKPNSQVFNHSDDVWCLAGITDVLPLPDDNFLVEDLLNLDFSEKEHHEECFPHVDEEQKISQESNGNHSSATFSSGGTDELVLPFDDLENLEWLSQYVDESAAELSLLCPAGGLTANAGLSRGERMERVARPVQKTTAPFSPSPVPRKARTKLPTRPLSHRRWHLPSADSLPLTFPNGSPSLPPFMVGKLPVKRQRKTPEADSGRKCTHCQANRTPQWRTGPLGPKTLCNACGVRFKSGRLFPEYRPACSPTFSRQMHSNSHRKVLEIRSKKIA